VTAARVNAASARSSSTVVVDARARVNRGAPPFQPTRSDLIVVRHELRGLLQRGNGVGRTPFLPSVLAMSQIAHRRRRVSAVRARAAAIRRSKSLGSSV
jgi:hypothetical protein